MDRRSPGPLRTSSRSGGPRGSRSGSACRASGEYPQLRLRLLKPEAHTNLAGPDGSSRRPCPRPPARAGQSALPAPFAPSWAPGCWVAPRPASGHPFGRPASRQLSPPACRIGPGLAIDPVQVSTTSRSGWNLALAHEHSLDGIHRTLSPPGGSSACHGESSIAASSRASEARRIDRRANSWKRRECPTPGSPTSATICPWPFSARHERAEPLR
jgi:hypothetical protein